MKISFPEYVVNAFTNELSGGNPAAVCHLEFWPDKKILQSIAFKNNLSETAFFVRNSNGNYDLRWFTPKVEVDLCGHATLASAFVILTFIEPGLNKVYFQTKSGPLSVSKNNKIFWLDLPSRKASLSDKYKSIDKAFGEKPLEIFKSRDILAIFENEEKIRNMKPDYSALKEIKDVFGFIISAPGHDVDFVSRFFAPTAGVNEDPVTGSSHCTLIPFWSKRLGKTKLTAKQLSTRSGKLLGEYLGERVKIGGCAILYSKNEKIL